MSSKRQSGVGDRGLARLDGERQRRATISRRPKRGGADAGDGRPCPRTCRSSASAGRAWRNPGAGSSSGSAGQRRRSVGRRVNSGSQTSSYCWKVNLQRLADLQGVGGRSGDDVGGQPDPGSSGDGDLGDDARRRQVGKPVAVVDAEAGQCGLPRHRPHTDDRGCGNTGRSASGGWISALQAWHSSMRNCPSAPGGPEEFVLHREFGAVAGRGWRTSQLLAVVAAGPAAWRS